MPIAPEIQLPRRPRPGIMFIVRDELVDVLAAAQSSLDRGRTAEAAQGFRRAIVLDRADPRGHIGLARCLAMVGQGMGAVERLVRTGRELASARRSDEAYAVLAEALRLDPARIELHVDLAELEIARGDRESGVARLRELASAYLAFGHAEDGLVILESIEALDHDTDAPVPGAIQRAQTGVTEPMSVILRGPLLPSAREETVIARTVLRFPDGTVIPGQAQPMADLPRRPALAPKPRVRFRVPSAPRLQPPRVARSRR